MVTSTLEFNPLSQLLYTLRGQSRRVLLALLALTILTGGLFIAGRLQQDAPALPLTDVNAAIQSEPTATAASTPAPATPPVAPAAVPLDCTPDTAYTAPSAISLADKPAGLSETIDTASYYQIHGYTTAQIYAQIQQCAPSNTPTHDGEKFAALTAYNLTWQYDTIAASNGTCTVANVKVGLHVNMALPQWTSTPSASAGLAGAWKTFVRDLTVHENGHVAIDRQYAVQLLHDLQSLPATDCASMKSTIDTKTSAVLAALDHANESYDDHTGHGETQGAVLR